ncbi:MAG: LAGLIDADG family homing endonuclease [Candidatus Heimdallarchaeota archaeon]|nr:LAGLIDADG family homing endonuclease [Candidatus Heimdallarchaeota archaeon]
MCLYRKFGRGKTEAHTNSVEETSVSHQDENKPIYNLRYFSKKVEDSKENPEDVLKWKKANLSAYLRGVFDGRGVIFSSDNGDMVLSIKHSSLGKLEIYQKALQMFSIHSFIYYPQEEEELSALYIVGKRNLRLFKDRIGFEYPEEADIFFNFWKTLDWED